MTQQEIHATTSDSGGRHVTVALGERSYHIEIGGELLSRAGELILRDLGRAKCVVVTDETVAELHLPQLQTALETDGLYAGSIVLPPGEGTKCFTQLETLCEDLLKTCIDRGDIVVVFGGGVIGDLGGFAASILRRGVRFVQIPTTLLSQVDSSVGGKTGINAAQGKNLIGTFHQPGLVIADLNVLETLPEREFRAGYAEVVKYGLINDAAFFAWLEDNWPLVFANDLAARAHAIEISCKAKAAIVAADERESGARGLLNLGHTFGHALEAWAGYSGSLIHGEGVSIGMILALMLSEDLGLAPEGTATRAETHLATVGLPTRIRHIQHTTRPDPQELVRHMGQDKKVKDGKLTFVLAYGIGAAFLTQDVPEDRLLALLARECHAGAPQHIGS